MTCASCNQAIQPTRIGSADYCPNCGHRLTADSPAAAITGLNSKHVHLRTLPNGTQVFDRDYLAVDRPTMATNQGNSLLPAEPLQRRHEAPASSMAEPTETRRRIGRFEDRFKQRGAMGNENTKRFGVGSNSPFAARDVTAASGAAGQVHHPYIPPSPHLPKLAGLGPHHRTASQFMHPKLPGANNLHRRGTSGPTKMG